MFAVTVSMARRHVVFLHLTNLLRNGFQTLFSWFFIADHGCFQIDRKTNAYELNQHFFVVELKSNTDKI